MAYDVQIKTDPVTMPLKPAILILAHRRRRKVFISYSSNARGRAAVLANVIRHRDTNQRGHLRDLPEGTVADFTLMAVNIGLDRRKADATIERYQKKFEREGFGLFGGTRSAVPKVYFNGRRQSLVDAMAEAKTKTSYQTVYRRIQRGWPVKEALDLAPRAA